MAKKKEGLGKKAYLAPPLHRAILEPIKIKSRKGMAETAAKSLNDTD